jgi:hypothetical protein
VSDECNPWSQMPDEPDLWYGRFMAFLRLGTKRSVNGARSKALKKSQENSRANAGPEWYEAAKEWRWEERARAYDDLVRAEEDRVIAEEREKVLRSGFALQHKRIQALQKLTDKLIEMTDDEEKIWMPDVKSVGTGPTAERVDLLQFNAPLFTLIDKYLGSIASEMGERVKKKDVTLTELPPNVYTGFDPDQDGVDS